MALIALEGMRFYAYHGYYLEEQIVGNDYILDIYINASTGAAAKEDDLEKTINYETVYTACQIEMRKPSKLLENIASRVIARLKGQFNNLQTIKVRIRKLNPIIGGPVEQSYIEEEVSFVKKCPRCDRKFVCYDNDDCWCQSIHFFPKTKETIKRKYRGCVCNKCQTLYAN